MSDPDSTPTRPLPADAPETAATEPLAPHVPFMGVEPATQPAGTQPPRPPRNWSWVTPAIVLVAIATTAIVLAAIGAFSQEPAPIVQSPTVPPAVTPTAPSDTVDEPDGPSAPPAEEPTQPPAPEPTEEPTPEPTEPEPTPTP